MANQSDRAGLVDTALGDTPADIAIRGGKLVNVFTREIHPVDILIQGERIAAVLPASDDPLPARWVISAAGRYIAPGLVDPHMHIESSALTLTEFARAVVPRGITTIIADPHEFGNIMGKPGIELVLEEAKQIPLNVVLRVPPRIPELEPHLETPGATITLEETCELLALPQAACLAGDISPLFYLRKDPAQFRLIEETIRLGKTVSGYSPGLLGRKVNGYVAAGAEDSHTPHDVAELREDLRAGLNCFLTPRPKHFDREQFRALAEMIAHEPIDTRKICFCTDDIHTNLLLEEGQLDVRVRMAIEEGIPPALAIQMATLNPAVAMRIDRDYGVVAAGRYADILILDDLETLSVETVLYHGQLVVEDKVYQHRPETPFVYPLAAKQTIKTKGPIVADTLKYRVNAVDGTATCQVLDVSGARKLIKTAIIPVTDGVIAPVPGGDICNLVVIDRHHANGKTGRGFVRHCGITRGALASTVNHNVHHLFAVGTNQDDMALALNRLMEIGGGYVAALDGKIIGEVALPIIGMLSELSLEDLAAAFTIMDGALQDGLGCTDPNRPLLSFSFMCSPVSLEAGLTDIGLVNSMTLEIEPVVLSLDAAKVAELV
jgi:adenine deaminase